MDIINESIQCGQCRQLLESPVVLPCGNSICREHVTTSVEPSLYCLSCQSDHEIPEAGFWPNRALEQIISTRIRNFKYPEDYVKSIESCNVSLMLVKQMKDKLDSSAENYITKMYDEMRNKIELKREMFKLIVADEYDKLADNLDTFKQDCLNNIDKHGHLIEEVKQLKDNLKKRLQESDKTSDMDAILKDSQQLEAKFKELKDALMRNKLHLYRKQMIQFAKLDFKVIDDGPLSSHKSKILTDEQKKQLSQLCKFSEDKKWSLLYRASDNGFESQIYHSKCNNVPETLVVVEVKTPNKNYIFGGFNKVCRTSNETYVEDADAFIFSLENDQNEPIVIPVIGELKEYAIYDAIDCGPGFGAGPDFLIASDAHMVQSRSNLGFTYKHPKFAYESTDSKKFLAGDGEFKVSDYEVFQISKNLY